MEILVSNNHLQNTGGSENFTFALALELKRTAHNVEYYTLEKGATSDRFEQEGIPFMSKSSYDLILANHITTVERLFTYGFIIQTCHGTIHELEQPSPFADMYVCVTQEVEEHLHSQGFMNTHVLLNGIDCNRFSQKNAISPKLSRVLSLSHSDKLNSFIRDCCDSIGVEFYSCNKYTDNVWEIESKINEVDLVVGIGRSIYDAMACGRCVISYDYRDYISEAIGDGYLNQENIEESIRCNCSGRSSHKTFNKEEFIQELGRYNPKDGAWARKYALNNLNIEHSALAYLSYYKYFNPHIWDASLNLKKTLYKQKVDLEKELSKFTSIRNKPHSLKKFLHWMMMYFKTKV